MNKKAMYPGSFDPFTNGHLDIVKKSSELFDEVHIVIAVNSNKHRTYDAKEMKEAIKSTLNSEGIFNVIVEIYNGLVANYAKENGIKYMIRGLRNSMDYNYEENIASVNKMISPEIEYIYFRAENVAVSSSMVRELRLYGNDISPYVPQSVLKIL